MKALSVQVVASMTIVICGTLNLVDCEGEFTMMSTHRVGNSSRASTADVMQ